MAFLRVKIVKGLQYFYLVENKRDIDGVTRQRIIEYLGKPTDALKKAEELGLPEGMLQKIKEAFPKATYIILKLNRDGTRETYYRDWDDNFMERH